MKELIIGVLIGAFGGSLGGFLQAFWSTRHERRETNAAIEKLREEYRRSK